MTDVEVHRATGLSVVLISLAIVIAGPALARTPGAVGEEDLPLIKAALVYNICKFVTWPGGDIEANGFLLAVAGDDGVPDLESLSGKPMHGVDVRVVKANGRADSTAWKVLYLASDALDDASWFGAVPHGVLTVSDVPGFAARGGVIELTMVDGRLRIIVNKTAAHKAGLDLSSQLLKIAKDVLN